METLTVSSDFDPTSLSGEDFINVKTALTTENIDILFEERAAEARKASYELIAEWTGAAPEEMPSRINTTKAEARNAVLDSYLDAHNIDIAHPAYDTICALIEKYDYLGDSVKHSVWALGDEDEPTSKKAFYSEVSVLLGESLADVAEKDVLTQYMEEKRLALAELSVQRRARLTQGKGKKSRDLKNKYEAAQTEYNDAYIKLGAQHVEQLRAEGLSEEEVAQAVIMGTVAERLNFSMAERASLEKDTSFKNRLARFYAKRSGMVITNVALGAATGVAARKAFKYGALAAIPVAGVAGLAAARVAKSVFTSTVGSKARLHSDLLKREQEDLKRLHSVFSSPEGQIPIGDDIEGSVYADISQNILADSIDNRVNKDIKSNRNRAIASAAIAGTATVVAAVLVGNLDHQSLPGKVDSHGGGAKLTDETLRNAGVKDPLVRRDILEHPDAFKHMVENPDEFGKYMHAMEGAHRTLPLITPEGFGAREFLTNTEAFTIHRGGGLIKDVIRPMAHVDGHDLTSAQETQVWQAVRTRFGDNLFTNLTVRPHGSDQWISQSGQGNLKPEVARFIRDQIASIGSR